MASPASHSSGSSSVAADLSNDGEQPSHPRRPEFGGGPQKTFPMGMYPAVLPVPAYGMQNGFRGSMMPPPDGLVPMGGMGGMVSGPRMAFPFHPGMRMMPGPVPMMPHGFSDHMMGRHFPRPFMMGQHGPLGNNPVGMLNAGMEAGILHFQQNHRPRHRPEGGQNHHRREYSSGSTGSGGSGDLRSSTSGVSVQEMKELEDLLSKLNPLAKEFVPPGSEEGGSGSGAGPRQGGQNGKGKVSRSSI